MNGLDIVLFNVISYLGGILSGILIHHKMTKSKKKEKVNEDNKIDTESDREKDVTDKHESPVLTATPVPTAPPPFNPGLSKRITITTE